MVAGAGQRQRPWHRHRREEGSVALYMAIITVALLAMAGLVIDGGAAIAARGKAADLAQQAARAGANALAPDSLRGTSPSGLRVDPAAAQQAAGRVLTLGGATGEVSVNGLQVTVVAHMLQRAAVLSAVGITDLTGTAAATATVLHGMATGGP
jgi:Flp pilus assembly protein TadG